MRPVDRPFGAAVPGPGQFQFPGLDVGVPAAVVFPAFDIEVDAEHIAGLELAFIDLVAPDGDADFFGVGTLGFDDYVLLFPGAVFAGTGLQGKQGDELGGELHGMR